MGGAGGLLDPSDLDLSKDTPPATNSPSDSPAESGDEGSSPVHAIVNGLPTLPPAAAPATLPPLPASAAESPSSVVMQQHNGSVGPRGPSSSSLDSLGGSFDGTAGSSSAAQPQDARHSPADDSSEAEGEGEGDGDVEDDVVPGDEVTQPSVRVPATDAGSGAGPGPLPPELSPPPDATSGSTGDNARRREGSVESSDAIPAPPPRVPVSVVPMGGTPISTLPASIPVTPAVAVAGPPGDSDDAQGEQSSGGTGADVIRESRADSATWSADDTRVPRRDSTGTVGTNVAAVSTAGESGSGGTAGGVVDRPVQDDHGEEGSGGSGSSLPDAAAPPAAAAADQSRFAMEYGTGPRRDASGAWHAAPHPPSAGTASSVPSSRNATPAAAASASVPASLAQGNSGRSSALRTQLPSNHTPLSVSTHTPTAGLGELPLPRPAAGAPQHAPQPAHTPHQHPYGFGGPAATVPQQNPFGNGPRATIVPYSSTGAQYVVGGRAAFDGASPSHVEKELQELKQVCNKWLLLW